MKKKLLILSSVAVVAIVGVVFVVILNTNNTTQTEKNYGISHMVQTINDGKVESFDASTVVPNVEELVNNLEEEEYTITKYDSFTNNNIACNRIYAQKGDNFIDICYGLDMANTDSVFSEYEKKYKSYYILAQNDEYVYCVSDQKTFKNSGFRSLANCGVQYINE